MKQTHKWDDDGEEEEEEEGIEIILPEIVPELFTSNEAWIVLKTAFGVIITPVEKEWRKNLVLYLIIEWELIHYYVVLNLQKLSSKE